MKRCCGHRLGPPEVQSKTAGVFVAAFALGLLVNIFIIFLTQINFAPLQAIAAADDALFFSTTPPPIQNADNMHRVVLIDIDDDATQPGNIENGGRAPRGLIADVIRKVRAQEPTAIFVDIDLRNGFSDDQPLLDELRKPHEPPVLVPYFLEGVRSRCKDQTGVDPALRPVLLGSPFRSVSASGSVIEVHGLMDVGAYGFVEGTCSSILLHGSAKRQTEIPAAMVEAAALAGHRLSSTSPTVVRPLWRIRYKQEPPYSARNPRWRSGRKSLYTWIPARDIGFAPKDLFESAIVILGSSQTGSDDIHYTPVGLMTGALIHVNLALDLQQPETQIYSWQNDAWQAAFDTILTLATAAAVAWFCWHPLHLRFGGHHKPTPMQRGNRLLGELGILTLLFLLAAGGSIVVARCGGGGLALWRYSFIGSLLSALLVIVMEGIFLLTEMTQEGVEWAILYMHRRHRLDRLHQLLRLRRRRR